MKLTIILKDQYGGISEKSVEVTADVNGVTDVCVDIDATAEKVTPKIWTSIIEGDDCRLLNYDKWNDDWDETNYFSASKGAWIKNYGKQR